MADLLAEISVACKTTNRLLKTLVQQQQVRPRFSSFCVLYLSLSVCVGACQLIRVTT
jgi:hypothetical protein